jgi:3-carboxy-cis,cis-muconate cycloisomerase
VGSAAAWLRDALVHLEVDVDRVRANADLTGGLALAEQIVTALTPQLGRLPAHDLVAAASDRALAEGTDLCAQLVELDEVTAVLDRTELSRLLDPADATGTARAQFDRALAARERTGTTTTTPAEGTT